MQTHGNLNQNILTVTAVFLNQMRMNVCKHTTKMASLESFLKVPPGGSEEWMVGDLKGNYLFTILCITPLSPLSLANRHDWRDTRGKWPLARNTDRSWWHRHISLKFFWLQPMAPCTQKNYFSFLNFDNHKIHFYG